MMVPPQAMRIELATPQKFELIEFVVKTESCLSENTYGYWYCIAVIFLKVSTCQD